MTDRDLVPAGAAATQQELVEEIVAQLVGDIAPDGDERLSPDLSLVADLGYNSLLVIELAFALEDLFGLGSTRPEDAPPIGTLGDLQRYIAEKVASGQATVPAPDDVQLFLGTR
ncbi:hypothetical protein GCM10010172_65830 [Paractinoplanes ferrugineus]|uniref:Carrier domain-containing protein n=1 Tax=Paractinoplanes ferrugineus TaxID=113564 RepID=A0A919J1W9_9ACTN|nr:acyl carrier protein [Actinoplanes ferrugineus]GIE13256.1 hypothetical protein Afe05nite_50960 [Actinoplanes ferrugineus]